MSEIKAFIRYFLISVVALFASLLFWDLLVTYLGDIAVIDKDKAGERLAEAIEATDFLVLTDVENAMLNFGRPDEKPLGEISLSEAEKYLAEGHFLRGSMGPKVEACIRFVQWGGKRAIITSLDNAVDAIDGKTGTHIIP